MITIEEACEVLNKQFPGIRAASTAEWDGTDSGIWFRQEGAEHPDGTYYFDYWSDSRQVHPEVEAALDELGFFAEPQDAGTWFAYRN